jgi:hypothetical protein
MPLLNTPNSENQAINTPLSEQKPAKFEKSRLGKPLAKGSGEKPGTPVGSPDFVKVHGLSPSPLRLHDQRVK